MEMPVDKNEKLSIPNSLGFFLIHIGCIQVFWAGFSWIALVVMLLSYGIRMFAITGVYHRYFSHRSYRTSRVFQFILAFLGCSAVQKGPLWWASYHRHHHRHSDSDEDIHSPTDRGLWWSHVGWILCKKYEPTHEKWISDFAKYPELRWLDKWYHLAALVLIIFLYILGAGLNALWPGLNTSGYQLVVWGFFISTTLLYHGTFTVNSLAHVIGRRRFSTPDDSRNSLLISLITLGEGWHNNHHRFPSSERQGFYWWELDITHYTLRALSKVGLVWDLRTPPKRVYEEGKKGPKKLLRSPNRKITEGSFQ